MKAKKLAAVFLSVLIMGGTLRSVENFGKNTAMGAEMTISDQFNIKDGIVYKKDNDHVVLSDAKGADGVIVVPETVTLKEGILKEKEYPVTVIGANAFAGTDVTEVILPKNIQRICQGAFRGCADLEVIRIENKDCVIESRAGSGDTICSVQSNGSQISSFTGEIQACDGSPAKEYADLHGYRFKEIVPPSEEDNETVLTNSFGMPITTTVTTSSGNKATSPAVTTHAAVVTTKAARPVVTTAGYTNPLRFVTETTLTNPLRFVTEATTTTTTTTAAVTNPLRFVTEAATTSTAPATVTATATHTNPLRFVTEKTTEPTTTVTSRQTTVLRITTATRPVTTTEKATTTTTTTVTSRTTTAPRTTTNAAANTTSYVRRLNAVESGDVITTTTVSYPPANPGEPVFHLSDTVVCLDDAQTKNQHVTISVDGANGLYCNTLIYVYFDSRMKVGEAYGGPAIQKLATGQAVGDTGDFIVLVTAGRANDGKDGVMWEIEFTLPSDCQVGDVFTFEIGPTKYGMEPIFSDVDCSTEGMALTDYIFTKGIDAGSITVVDNQPYALGDVNNDKLIDSVDASMVLAEYAFVSSGNGTRFRNNQQPVAADVDENGIVDAVDASTILAYYAYVSGNGENIPFTDFVKRKK